MTIVVVDALGLSYLKLIALFLLQFSTNSRLNIRPAFDSGRKRALQRVLVRSLV